MKKSILNLVRDNIKSLKPYSSARSEFKGAANIFLDANESPYGTLNRYPDPLQKELKKLLSEELSVNTDQLFIGNGSDEVIDLLFRIFCNPRVDNVVAMDPSYGMYDVSAGINDVEVNKVDLDENFDIDLNSILSSVDQNTKIIFICSPNNPTGNYVTTDTITQLCNSFDGIVLVDEAYIDFCSETSSIKVLSKCPNLIISQTFSKAKGLASARVGYAITNPTIIDLLNKVKPPYNVSDLNQKAAINCLRSSNFKKELEIIVNQRDILKKELSLLDIVTKIYPSHANFLLVEFEEANKIYNHLVEKGIITRNRNQYVNNTIRITIGSPEENQKLLKALKDITNG